MACPLLLKGSHKKMTSSLFEPGNYSAASQPAILLPQNESTVWTDSVRMRLVGIHCVSKTPQSVPPLTCYNLYIHCSIATIFGKNVAE